MKKKIIDNGKGCEEFELGSPSGKCESTGHYTCKSCKFYIGVMNWRFWTAEQKAEFQRTGDATKIRTYGPNY